MSPYDFNLAHYYPDLDIDTQVRLQIALARHYAKDFLDLSIAADELRVEIIWMIAKDLVQLEAQEKYEYCMLYKDTIENVKFISIEQLY